MKSSGSAEHRDGGAYKALTALRKGITAPYIILLLLLSQCSNKILLVFYPLSSLSLNAQRKLRKTETRSSCQPVGLTAAQERSIWDQGRSAEAKLAWHLLDASSIEVFIGLINDSRWQVFKEAAKNTNWSFQDELFNKTKKLVPKTSKCGWPVNALQAVSWLIGAV